MKFYKNNTFLVINSNGIITARKRSLGQGNVFTPVCHSVHRGRGSAQPPALDADPPGVGQTSLDADPLGWPDPPDADPPGVWQIPPPDTVNKRSVRILLECILVVEKFQPIGV